MSYFLRALACWARNAGHDYGAWEQTMGPNHYHIQCRTCQACGWVQTPERTNDP